MQSVLAMMEWTNQLKLSGRRFGWQRWTPFYPYMKYTTLPRLGSVSFVYRAWCNLVTILTLLCHFSLVAWMPNGCCRISLFLAALLTILWPYWPRGPVNGLPLHQLKDLYVSAKLWWHIFFQDEGELEIFKLTWRAYPSQRVHPGWFCRWISSSMKLGVTFFDRILCSFFFGHARRVSSPPWWRALLARRGQLPGCVAFTVITVLDLFETLTTSVATISSQCERPSRCV